MSTTKIYVCIKNELPGYEISIEVKCIKTERRMHGPFF
jgi:hypothetical protein